MASVPGTRQTPSVGIPAARPAATPGRESSTTTQRAGGDAEPLGREQEHVRRGLAVLDLVARDRDLELQAGARERAVQPLAHRGGRDGDPHATRPQVRDRLDRVRERHEVARRSARTARVAAPASSASASGSATRSRQYACVRA